MTLAQRRSTWLFDRGKLVEIEIDTLRREGDACPRCACDGPDGLEPICFYDELGREVDGLLCPNCEWRGLP
jgi:hypothetical protein